MRRAPPPRPARARGPLARLALGLGLVAGTACVEPVTLAPAADDSPLAVGQRRDVTLRALALQVEDFQQTLTLADLRALPRNTLDEVWLVDLDMTPLVENALAFLRDSEDGLTTQAARNMQKLLRLSPLDIDFAATQLESLLELSGSIGIPAAQAVADLLQIQRADPVIPLPIAAEALVAGLIASHPASQTRPGPIDADHPDGRWPVAPGAIPITLGDVIDDFAEMTERFGPTTLPDGRVHPGFIQAASGFIVTEDDFRMTVRVNANALPYKGVDLSSASVASVNSLGSQIERVFNTADPDWVVIDGLVPRPTISALTVKVTESDRFFLPGTDRAPLPTGNSDVWAADPWLLEPMVAQMVKAEVLRAGPRCVRYSVGAMTQVFEACVDATGWTTFDTFNDIGEAPDDGYLWDLQLDMAQVRLHDGGLPEGDADVEFTIRDVPLGINAIKLVEEIKNNLAADPRTLRELAQAINQTTVGAADVFYVHVPEGPEAGDWLWFIEPNDIPRAADGARERPYTYASPGFFADAALTQPVGERVPVAGDADHIKVFLRPGERHHVADDAGGVYALTVGRKPSPRQVTLTVERLR